MTILRRRRIVPLLTLATTLVATAASSEEAWSGEVGLLVGNHDNFFHRGGGNPAPSSDMLEAHVSVERAFDTGPAEWTLSAVANAVQVLDIDEADYHAHKVAAEYKRGSWKLFLGYGETLNRLYSESGEATFFDQSELDLWLRYSLGPRLWVRLRARVQDWDFDPAENARDADVDRFEATVRFAASERLGVRLSYLSDDREAVAPDNNRTGDGLALAFEGTPSDRVSWFLRLRTRDRDYEDAPPDDGNFGRRDTVDDLNFNLRWRFADRLGLILRDSYRSGDSTRPDRNYSSHQIGVGLFYAFGPGGG